MKDRELKFVPLRYPNLQHYPKLRPFFLEIVNNHLIGITWNKY